jgi:hypothetical protein
MRKFNYTGVDKSGRTINGSTMAASEEEVRNQLTEFGFKNIHIEEATSSATTIEQPAQEGRPTEDLVQQLVFGDTRTEEAVDDEEAAIQEWERAETFIRIRRYRRRENIALVITLILLGAIAAYFVFDKVTEVSAPQPEIVTRRGSPMLTFKDVYVKGQELVFIVHAPNWNGNVRVDFKAWDPVDKKKPMDFGTARIGFIGDHYGGTPQKSGTFKLKKMRFYDRIEIVVSGDEKR